MKLFYGWIVVAVGIVVTWIGFGAMASLTVADIFITSGGKFAKDLGRLIPVPRFHRELRQIAPD